MNYTGCRVNRLITMVSLNGFVLRAGCPTVDLGVAEVIRKIEMFHKERLAVKRIRRLAGDLANKTP